MVKRLVQLLEAGLCLVFRRSKMSNEQYERLKKIETDLRQIKTNQHYPLAQMKVHKYEYISPTKNGIVRIVYKFIPYERSEPCLLTIKYDPLDNNGNIASYEIDIIDKMEELKKDDGGFYYGKELNFSTINYSDPVKLKLTFYSTSEGTLHIWTK